MNKNLFIQSYGCAMNFSDSEIVASILKKDGYSLCNKIEESDLVLINTFTRKVNRKWLLEF